MQPVRNNDAASTAAVSEFCEALRNALEFGEAERILFAMESLRNMLNAELDRTDAAQLCNDVLYLVRRWMEQHEDKAGVQSIRALAQAFIVSSLPPRDASNQLLDQIMELLAPRLTPQEQEENNLIQCIENYLSENYRDADFTVQRGLCSKNSVNATSVTKSEISRFRSRRPLPPDPYCSAPTQPPPLAAAWPWQVIGKNAKLNRRRDTFVSEISEFRHRRRD